MDSPLKALCDGASGDVVLERHVLATLLSNFALWKERHRKYGRGNIAEFGALGCLVRSADKLARLRRTYLESNATFTDESIVDSWRDLANYALMGQMCHLGQWPGIATPQGERGGEALLSTVPTAGQAMPCTAMQEVAITPEMHEKSWMPNAEGGTASG